MSLRNVGQIHERKLGHAPLELAEACVHKFLALLRHVVLGVLRQIAHGHGLLDLGRQFVSKLVLKCSNLFEKLLFDVIGHPCSVAASGAAQPQEMIRLDSLIIRGTADRTREPHRQRNPDRKLAANRRPPD